MRIPLSESFDRDIFYCIYHILNNENGKVYVGKCWQLNDRLGSHRCELKKGTHHNKALQDDFNIYGINAFSVLLIADEIEDGLDRAEREEIHKQKLISYNPPKSELKPLPPPRYIEVKTHYTKCFDYFVRNLYTMRRKKPFVPTISVKATV